MIELYVINWLKDALPGVHVCSVDERAKDPERVVVERTGGGNPNHIRTAMVAIQSYGQSKYQAALLHERVLEAMPGMIAQDNISAVTLNSEYDYPDLTTKENRYQAVYNIVYY